MLHVLEAPGQFRADLVEDDLVLEEENVGVKNGGFLSPEIWIMRSRRALICTAVVWRAR